MKLHARAVLALALAVVLLGCASQESSTSEPPAAAGAQEEEITITAEEAVQVMDDATHVTLYVTSAGFVPSSVHVPAGKPVHLMVTRKTDKTCATELVMPAHEINQPLPLNEVTEITFTPEEAGELQYACGMDMIRGSIVVD